MTPINTVTWVMTQLSACMVCWTWRPGGGNREGPLTTNRPLDSSAWRDMTGHTHILCVIRFTEAAERKLECYCIVDHIDTSRFRLFIVCGQFSTILKYPQVNQKWHVCSLQVKSLPLKWLSLNLSSMLLNVSNWKESNVNFDSTTVLSTLSTGLDQNQLDLIKLTISIN